MTKPLLLTQYNNNLEILFVPAKSGEIESEELASNAEKNLASEKIIKIKGYIVFQ